VYTKGVDIWAVGTILGEMINGRPIFPGTSTMNQIERIIEVINFPAKSDIDSINSQYASTMLESLPPMNYKLIGDVFPAASTEAIDLIRSCFHFNPTKRPSAEELLKHVFVADFHNEEEEPIYPYGPLKLPIDDNIKLTAPQYRERLYQEITNRRKESRRKDSSSHGVGGNGGMTSNNNSSHGMINNSSQHGASTNTLNSNTSAHGHHHS
jgi:mitogen-activated protein kinase 15